MALFVKNAGMTTLPTGRGTAPDLSADEFEVGYIAGDGAAVRLGQRGRPAAMAAVQRLTSCWLNSPVGS
jgi:hypothetical protein